MASVPRRRWLATCVVVLATTAGCVSAGSDAIERVASEGSEQLLALGVREVAVGTWRCTEAYDDEVTQELLIGITPDGRWGTGQTEGHLREAGSWELVGLRLEVDVDLESQGVALPASLTYTGDADPPSTIHVVDHANGDSEGDFDVTVQPDRFTAEQSLTYAGADHVKRYACDKRSDEVPDLRPA